MLFSCCTYWFDLCADSVRDSAARLVCPTLFLCIEKEELCICAVPALIEPFLASLKSPFFFRIKLPPMKMLELIANARPM